MLSIENQTDLKSVGAPNEALNSILLQNVGKLMQRIF